MINSTSYETLVFSTVTCGKTLHTPINVYLKKCYRGKRGSYFYRKYFIEVFTCDPSPKVFEVEKDSFVNAMSCRHAIINDKSTLITELLPTVEEYLTDQWLE